MFGKHWMDAWNGFTDLNDKLKKYRIKLKYIRVGS